MDHEEIVSWSIPDTSVNLGDYEKEVLDVNSITQMEYTDTIQSEPFFNLEEQEGYKKKSVVVRRIVHNIK